jgi:hypothetical protein
VFLQQWGRQLLYKKGKKTLDDATWIPLTNVWLEKGRDKHFFPSIEAHVDSPPFFEATYEIFLDLIHCSHLLGGRYKLFPATLAATLLKSSIRSYELRTLDWGDMMTYSLYMGHKPIRYTLLAPKPTTSGLP